MAITGTPSTTPGSARRSSTSSVWIRGPGQRHVDPEASASTRQWVDNNRRCSDARRRDGRRHMITISAFKWVPDFARGQVRDLRVRWALEEAGLAYGTRLLEQGDQNKPEYRALQPFGQVPIFEEKGLVLFESGAIVLHIAERSEVLLPKDPAARARAVQWLIAALNSVEPAVWNVFVIDNLYPNEEWARLRRPSAAALMNKK